MVPWAMGGVYILQKLKVKNDGWRATCVGSKSHAVWDIAGRAERSTYIVLLIH